MQGSIRVHLEELAELREKAELLCAETQEIINEYRRLKAGLRDRRPKTPPISIVSADLTTSYAVPPDPRLRPILPNPEHPASRLGLSPDAPPGDKPARQRRIGEIDREGVIQHTARSRGCDRPAGRATVLV